MVKLLHLCQNHSLVTMVTDSTYTSLSGNTVKTSSTKKVNTDEKTPETASLPTEPKAVSPVDQGARNAILELVGILKDSELIIEEEAEFITDVLYGRNSEVDFEDEEEDEEEEETDDTGSYSESDLDDMFDFIKN